MDPKNNANPTGPDDGQPTQPQADAQNDSIPSLGNEETPKDTVGTSADAPTGADSAGSPVSPKIDSAAPEEPETARTPSEVAGLGDMQPSITSETPASPPESTTPPVVTPPADSDIPATPVSQPGEPVPPVAPAPTPGNDKKTIMILGIVAAVLVVAIAALYLVA